nr:hypothetical protein Iba_chr08dCG14210 [Ipomoea batatas]GME10166.1 hypothetical protein Iba_scaffold9659CG0020 [Ipomoea batatas]
MRNQKFCFWTNLLQLLLCLEFSILSPSRLSHFLMKYIDMIGGSLSIFKEDGCCGQRLVLLER